MRFYVICTTPRSGSNFLCRQLTRHGAFGRPGEFFNFHEPLFRYSQELGAASFDDYIDKLIASHGVADSVFGWKAFWFDFIFLRDLAGKLDRFQPLHYVYLERRDEIAQAISFAYAKATNAWTSESVMEADLPYDRRLIDSSLGDLRWNRQGWDDYFQANAIEPLRIDYDDLIADPQPAVEAIARLLGVTPLAPEASELPPLQAQREPGKARWLERYRQELAAPALSGT